MEMDELRTLIGEGIGKLRDKVVSGKDYTTKEQYLKQYDPKQHDIFSRSLRKDKQIKTDQGDDVVRVARLPIPFQQIIVNRAATFLCGNPIELNATPEGPAEENMLAILKKVWRDNKLDFESGTIAQKMMSETEAAELWYVEKLEPNSVYWKNTPASGSQFRLRVKILSADNSDGLYPILNRMGDMIAFCRAYHEDLGGKRINYFDTYTENYIYEGKEVGTTWETVSKSNGISEVANGANIGLGKIQIIYYSQPVPEWHNVQEMIDRKETRLSNLADTNDYSGDPMLIIYGEIKEFVKKGESGKLLRLDGDKASAEYLVPANATQSIELELDTLRSLIMDMTDTPDISFEKMKSIGGNLTNFGVKMMFLGAHMKAASKMPTFGKSVQRRINFLVHAIGVIIPKLEAGNTITIEPKFEYYLPKNVEEAINILTTAVTGGILSKETAVGLNPLVSDPEAELNRLKDEENSPAKLDENMNQDN